MKVELENVIERIQKLLRLSESQNLYEAQSAIAFARKLMAKHNLSMKDVREQEEDKIIEDATEVMRSPWKRMLAIIIAEHFRCKTYIKTYGRSYAVVFLGLEDDVFITSLIYRQVVNIINANCQRNRHHKKSYATGFISGLNKKLEEQNRAMKEDNGEEYAMVAITPASVIKHYEELAKGFSGSFKGKQITRKDIEYKAYKEGRKDGLEYTKDEQVETEAV